MSHLSGRSPPLGEAPDLASSIYFRIFLYVYLDPIGLLNFNCHRSAILVIFTIGLSPGRGE
jgi:hypothetical protein